MNNIFKKVLLSLLLMTLVAIAYLSAVRTEMPSIDDRLKTSVVLFVLAGATGLTYCSLYPKSISWGRSISGSVMFLLLGSLLYSVIRHDFILIPFPLLFCLPGASLGGAWALSLAERRGDLMTLDRECLTDPSDDLRED